jgi:uncharacterized protein YkwD
LSGYGYEQEPRFEYGPVSHDPDYGQFGQYPGNAPDLDEEPRRGKTTKVLIVGGAVVALLLVGMVAFAGTVLLGGAGGGGKNNVASGTGGGQEVADPATSAPSETPSDPPTTVAPSPTKASPTRSAPGKTPTKPGGGPVNAGPEGAVLAIVNNERAKAGCKALTVDGRLAAAARKHSADMVKRHYFSHTTPDGVTMAKRIDNEGYRWSTIGENIAAGQPNATEVMKAWMNSPGHRANILNCKFQQIGIGVAFDGRRPVWTQDFGTPR